MKQNLKGRLAAALLCGLMLVPMSGCGGKPTAPEPPPKAPTAPELPVDDPGVIEAPEEVSPIYVTSTRELLDSIAPDAEILIGRGYYNMSEYVEEVWAAEGEAWNQAHPYVQLRECFDGVEIVIRDVDGLNLSGDSVDAADTELVADPRYSTVLTFVDCGEISVSNLTMGHTERGDCAGNVLNFYSCRDVVLNNMDLYGCGVYGIGCYEGTGEVYVEDTVIRDCSYGPLEIYGCAGVLEFRSCWLYGSEAYAWYEDTEQSELNFYECEFGENETSYFMFHEDVRAEDCLWSSDYIYPDPEFGYDMPTFDPETMKMASLDREWMSGTIWDGYAQVNPESGEAVVLPYEDDSGNCWSVYMELYADGTGWLESVYDTGTITWECPDEYTLCIRTEGGASWYATAYTMAGEDAVWLLMELSNNLYWLY